MASNSEEAVPQCRIVWLLGCDEAHVAFVVRLMSCSDRRLSDQGAKPEMIRWKLLKLLEEILQLQGKASDLWRPSELRADAG